MYRGERGGGVLFIENVFALRGRRFFFARSFPIGQIFFGRKFLIGGNFLVNRYRHPGVNRFLFILFWRSLKTAGRHTTLSILKSLAPEKPA